MAYVDLSAFETAVNNSQSIVTSMQTQIGNLSQALSFLKQGIASANTQNLYKACTEKSDAVEKALQKLQTLLKNIDNEKQISERRLNTLD